MSFDELVDTMSRADSVVCHAGVGTIMSALKTGHTPVVIPRRATHGEHVDDHQMDIAIRFQQRGLVRCVTTETDLAPLLTPRKTDANRGIGQGSSELRTAVSAAVDGNAAHRRWRLWH